MRTTVQASDMHLRSLRPFAHVTAACLLLMTDDLNCNPDHWLKGLETGDPNALNQLLQCSRKRLHQLTHRMLQQYPGVRIFEQTDDVLQNAMLRLQRAVADIKPTSLREFLRLAALQIRRELIDLARHYQSQRAQRASEIVPCDHSGATPADDPSESTRDPRRLASWSEFHEQIGALPDEEREVFDLLWYEGLSQEAAAEALKVSVKTVKRRWQQARRLLCRNLQGELPF